jgi:membrane dipeptidase
VMFYAVALTPAQVSLIARVTIVLLLTLFVSTLASLFCFKFNATRTAVLSLLLSIVVSVVLVPLPNFIDASINFVDPDVKALSQSIPDEVLEFHQSLFIGDMHADTLLWPKRNPLVKNEHGHVDIPRLLEGNVALQAFTIVTQTPAKMNFDHNAKPSLAQDSITQKALLELWGIDCVTSLAARTLFQTKRLHSLADESNGVFRVIETKQDLQKYIEDRKTLGNKITAGFLGIEGLHALDSKIENVDVFFQNGVRFSGFAHFFDNDLGGSAHGMKKFGMTDFGKQVLASMEEIGMIVDIAHNSEKLIDDIIKYSKKPIVSSHTGAYGVCPGPRNLKDDHLRAIAASKGLISVGYFKPVICGDSYVEGIVKTVRYIVDLVGVDSVALGSDFDGAVVVGFDTSKLVYLTKALLDGGFTKQEVAKIMGGNLERFWLDNLPSA